MTINPTGYTKCNALRKKKKQKKDGLWREVGVKMAARQNSDSILWKITETNTNDNNNNKNKTTHIFVEMCVHTDNKNNINDLNMSANDNTKECH